MLPWADKDAMHDQEHFYIESLKQAGLIDENSSFPDFWQTGSMLLQDYGDDALKQHLCTSKMSVIFMKEGLNSVTARQPFTAG